MRILLSRWNLLRTVRKGCWSSVISSGRRSRLNERRNLRTTRSRRCSNRSRSRIRYKMNYINSNRISLISRRRPRPTCRDVRSFWSRRRSSCWWTRLRRMCLMIRIYYEYNIEDGKANTYIINTQQSSSSWNGRYCCSLLFMAMIYDFHPLYPSSCSLTWNSDAFWA